MPCCEGSNVLGARPGAVDPLGGRGGRSWPIRITDGADRTVASVRPRRGHSTVRLSPTTSASAVIECEHTHSGRENLERGATHQRYCWAVTMMGTGTVVWFDVYRMTTSPKTTESWLDPVPAPDAKKTSSLLSG